MATLNAAATLEQVNDFATDFAGATLVILDGATTLATHTITSWTTSNTGNDGTATAVPASAPTIVADGTANVAELRAGSSVITLVIGTDITLTTTTYVTGETSTITSLVVTAPAA